jgi:nicotinate-nucleotide adenylyltransferase
VPEPSAITRIGVFGGTFNPIHLGHLRAAEEVCEAVGLARMLFVPSARPPHKRGESEAIAPAELRLEWARLATAGNPRFEVDPIEVERDGPSYLVDTLRAIGERIAPARPVFVLGHDAFVEMETWREPKTLFTLADFVAMTRPPLQRGHLADWLPDALAEAFEIAPDGLSARHRDAGTTLQLLAITALDVSASEIRERIASGRSVRYLIPPAVHDAVLASGCYGPSPGRDPGRSPGPKVET